ncbi:MAG: peptidoglycan DD-metalloendopeptidase family protein, partial [Dolichospermum sp.]
TTDSKNPQITLRSRTHQAAMIGLAISMGTASLLVTRQSDQAQAAAPIGSQKAVGTNSVVSETQIKFSDTKLDPQSVSRVGGVVNPVILEPTVVSKVPGLEAKWQIATNNTPVLSEASPREETASNVSPSNTAEKNSVYSQSQLARGVENNPIEPLPVVNNKETETAQEILPNRGQYFPAEELPGGNVDAQLKAQQEVALGRLREKSNRLRNSLAQLRNQRTQYLPNSGMNEEQPNTVSDNSLGKQFKNVTSSSQELLNGLKQNQESSITIQLGQIPAAISTKVAALPPSTYQVKPGDTLAEIANNYGISVSELIKANNLSDPHQLQISQKLIIPAVKMVDKVNKVDNPLNTPSFNTNSFVKNNTSVIVPSPIVAEQPQGLDGRAITTSSINIPVPLVAGERETNNNPGVTNRINVPAPINQKQIPIAIPQALPIKSESFGLGGDTALPRTLSAKEAEKISKAKGNERIRGLQAEIERLRHKYRTQESGVAATGFQNNSQAVSIPIQSTNNPVASQVGLQIPVPKAILPSYNNQPVRPLVTASGSTNEPINPEFMPIKTGVSSNSTPNSSGIKLTVPSPGISASDSLGKLRGTNVSPALPPLAAVDIYLPKTTEENPNFPSDSTTTTYMWPAKGVLTSGYGWRWGRMHRGIDIANSVGTPIYASSAGVVEKAGWNSGGYGNLVDIRHDDGSLTRYGHNSRILVQAGQRVQQGQTIAAMGSTGFSTGPHIHFEVHPAGKGAVNPIAFLPNRL